MVSPSHGWSRSRCPAGRGHDSSRLAARGSLAGKIRFDQDFEFSEAELDEMLEHPT